MRGRPGSLLPLPLRSSSGGGRTTGLAAGWALTSATPPSSLALSAFPLGPGRRPGARTYVALRRKPKVSGVRGKGGGNKVTAHRRARFRQAVGSGPEVT